MEWAGNPENRNKGQPMTYQERYDRFGNWSYDAVGTGQRNRGTDPATLSTGGSGNVRREWVDRPYNANAVARSNWGWTGHYFEGNMPPVWDRSYGGVPP